MIAPIPVHCFSITFTVKNVKLIYLTISDSICLISMPAHNLRVQLLPIVNRPMGRRQCFSYRSMFPTLTQLPTNIFCIWCKYIIDVYILKHLLGQAGEHTFIRKALKYNIIMQTCPCNEYPRTPHFYIVKLRFTGVYLIFLFLL